jgi:hypothetical protein
MWITFSEFIFFSENKIFTFVNANLSKPLPLKFSLEKKKIHKLMWITFFI